MGGKYTGPDMFEFARVLAAGQHRSEWYLSSGMDEMCLAAVMAGACGNIGSTLNYMPGPYVRIRSQAAQGRYREAQELQNAANRVTFGPHRPRFHRFPLRSHADAGHRRRQSAFAPYRIECNAGKVAAG